MPRGDGTGPPKGSAQRGARMRGSRPGAGPEGNCVCPSCGEKVKSCQSLEDVAVVRTLPGLTVVVPAAANADGWDWTLTPNLWVADVSVDVKVNDQEFLGGEVDFKDILTDVEFALPLRLGQRL